MKILLVTESYWPNADGGALFERRLAHGLIARGHDVTVWAPAPEFRSYDEADGDSLIHRERGITFLGNTKYKVSFFPFWHARRIILRDKPEVIHIHNCYWMGLSAMYWAKRYKIPVVATNHFMPENATMNLSFLPHFLYPLMDRLTWYLIVKFHNKANYVTSPTPTAVRLLAEHRLKAEYKAVTNGIDTSVFKPGQDAASVVNKYKLVTDQPVVLYLGRLDGEKRVDVIVAAFAEVLKTHKAQLVLAGFGKAMDDLRKQVKNLGIEKDVVFTGFLAEEDKSLIYNAAKVFVIASPAELQSIVTLEAMASALPIIAVDVAALHELCHDGENGYLFPNADVPVLADRIIKILDNPDVQKKFGQESLRIVKESHGTEHMLDEYESIYKTTAYRPR